MQSVANLQRQASPVLAKCSARENLLTKSLEVSWSDSLRMARIISDAPDSTSIPHFVQVILLIRQLCNQTTLQSLINMLIQQRFAEIT